MKPDTTTINARGRHIWTPLLAVLVAVGLLSLSGCDFFIDGGSSETSRIEARLTADPIPIDFVREANVTIRRVQLHGPSGTATLSDRDRKFNLLDLTDGSWAVLGQDHVEPGRYDELWIYVDDAEIVLDDGTRYDINVPNRRVKVDLDDLRIDDDENVILTLNFDVDDSFIVEGDSSSPDGITGFTFDPRIVTVDVDRREWKGDDDRGRHDDHDDDHDDDDDDDD